MRRLAASVVHTDRPDDAAIMRAADDDPTPGQSMLTRSVRVGRQYTWPATGRILRQSAYGVTQREICRSSAPLFVERVLDGRGAYLQEMNQRCQNRGG
ncbi:MAG: hypothetical protein LBV00_07755 [Propionibacteriaceae bacterium]|jgi:hypothetical protein|nr:hypothetical protein [Propionibacteriaceae bacterium]